MKTYENPEIEVTLLVTENVASIWDEEDFETSRA